MIDMDKSNKYGENNDAEYNEHLIIPFVTSFFS